MPDGKPGDGKTSPFGDGKGAPMTTNSGANDFIENPEGNAKSGGGRDFTKESREQKSGPADDIDKPSVPEGGMLPFGTGDKWAKAEDSADGGVEPGKSPFKNLK